MSDDRFDAFDQVEKADEDDTESESEPEAEPEPETAADDSGHTAETTPKAADGSLEDPAFDYSDSNQGPIYARPETWDRYDDVLELDVERYLRDNGVRNAQKRELHDAALRLAARHPEELGDLLIEARRRL
jgi:hypothetical protein